MGKANVFNEMTKSPSYKKGKPVTREQYVEAVDRIFDKKFPVIPNARKGQGGVKPTQKMTYNKQK